MSVAQNMPIQVGDSGKRITVTLVEYPHYSGPDVICVKCGHQGASTNYRAVGRCIDGHNDHLGVGGFAPNERLCRTCENCSYSWDEAIVAEPPTSEQVRDHLRFALQWEET